MKNPRLISRCNRRGFFLADVVTGLSIVGVLAIVMASTLNREKAAEARLADTRSALRVAEHVLLALQNNQSPPIDAAQLHIKMDRLPDPPAPTGYSWLKVEVTINGHSNSLNGIVPLTALPRGNE